MLQHAAELMLDGLSRVPSCTAIGRAAMASDVQHVAYGLSGLLPTGAPELSAALQASLRLVDSYIKVCLDSCQDLRRPVSPPEMAGWR